MGEDREEAIAAMDDDEAFDRWMANYQRKMAMKSKPGGSSGGGTRLSNDAYLNRFAKVHGGEEG